MTDEVEQHSGVGLWTYACLLYARDGVEPLLLALQDEDEADVLLLITACWLGAQGTGQNVEEWRALVRWHEPWREEVIDPLRRARRHVRSETGRSDLYGQLKAAELAAERLQLERLEVRLGGVKNSEKQASSLDMLTACCTAQGLKCSGRLEQRLESLAQLARS